MEFNWETFFTAYTDASNDTKKTIDSGVIGEVVNEVIESKKIESVTPAQLVLGISHVLLGTKLKEELMADLAKSGISNADGLVNEILNKIKTPATKTESSSLSEEIAETEAAMSAVPPVRTMAGDMDAQQQRVASEPAPTSNNDPAAIHYPNHSEPGTPDTQTAPANLPTAHIQSDEPVYTTTQEAILQKRAPQLIPEKHEAQQPTTPPTLKDHVNHQKPESDEARWGNVT